MNRLLLLLTIDLSAPNLKYISVISSLANSGAYMFLVQETYCIILKFQSTTTQSTSHPFLL